MKKPNVRAQTILKRYFMALVIAAIALSASGCSRNAQLRKAAIRALGSSNTAQLTADATALWNQHTGSGGFADIPESDWPTSFGVFKPVRVWRDSYGIYIITAKFVSKTAGVYITVTSGYTPQEAPNSQNERLTEGIYWTLTS